MKQAYFVTQVTVKDPETGGDVHMDVYKHQNGGMFAIDSSYLESIGDFDDEDDNIVLSDPFADPFEKFEKVELTDAPEID